MINKLRIYHHKQRIFIKILLDENILTTNIISKRTIYFIENRRYMHQWKIYRIIIIIIVIKYHEEPRTNNNNSNNLIGINSEFT